jgi:hypothetical protein
LLTAKQERFAHLIASEDISQVAAYIDAGYSSAQLDKQLRTKASALAGNGDIVGRVAELREAAREAAGVTRGGHLAKLAEIRDMALQGDKTAGGSVVKNYGAAVQAEGLRGKHSGVAAPDKHQDVTPDVPAEDAITELCTQAGVVHETARAHFMRGLEALKTPYTPMPVPAPTQTAPDMVQ